MKNPLRWIARVFSLQCVSGLAAETLNREKWLADLEQLKTELSRGYPFRRFDSPVQRARRLEGALPKASATLVDVSIILVISYAAMKTAAVIDALGALAHEYRLAIYRLLVEQGRSGLPAGVIGERVGLQPSSLTFHLQALHRAGLITQQRSSRQLIYSADYDVMNGLVGYLTDNCCAAEGGACCPAPAAPVPAPKTIRRRKVA